MWKKIRTFSPKYSDLPTMVSNVNMLFRVLTLNIDNSFTSSISFMSYLLTGSCAICYYYGYHLSLVWFLFWRQQDRNLTAMVVFGSLTVSSNIAITKLWYMIAYGSKVRCIVDQCISSNALIEPDSRFARNMNLNLRKVKIRGIFFWITLMTISILYVSIPAFMPGKHLPEDLLVFYGLDPPFETPNFQISYIITFSSVNIICYITATIAVFVIVIIGYNEAQMISLTEELLCTWDDSVQDVIEFSIDIICASEIIFDDHTKKKINMGVRKRLLQIMQNHSRIIKLLKNVNDFFNIPNAFAFGCLGISLIAELLGGLENTYLQVPFTFFQVALDCFTGQKIMDASMTFEKAVYACKWENFDKNNMKIVLLMLQNSQRTLTVTAGSMAVLNFGCLMAIVRSVYSSYTTLRSMI